MSEHDFFEPPLAFVPDGPPPQRRTQLGSAASPPGFKDHKSSRHSSKPTWSTDGLVLSRHATDPTWITDSSNYPSSWWATDPHPNIELNSVPPLAHLASKITGRSVTRAGPPARLLWLYCLVTRMVYPIDSWHVNKISINIHWHNQKE